MFGFGYYVANNKFMAHHTGFTAKTLLKALIQAGFVRAEVKQEDFSLWAGAKKS